ncbi:SH3 domain-containing protein [Listeria innocua]|uniref:SH3 domain-containing protein n=1 Tax=Listeria innocua TaxID=1642 RepID=UPI001FF99C3A|nr:SH3 domain-containing protein [Listeria innocua]UPH47509.1 SH3 domain-containing protein [Listeria innocua]
MNQTFIVKKEHISKYPNPLFVNKNESIWVFDEDTEHPGWIFCKVKSSAKEGWVPKQIIQLGSDGKTGTVTEDYSARELNVKPGDKLESNRELNGWVWCVTEDNEAGWVPRENLES